MTFDELMIMVIETFGSSASLGEDNDGQLVIYTNLEIKPTLMGAVLVPFEA